MTPDNIKALQARLALSELAMAAYLGIPVTTYRKWVNGQRRPDSAPLRLFAVLDLIERHAPDLHAALIGAARDATPAAQDRPQAARKGRGRVKGAPAAEKPVTGPQSQPADPAPAPAAPPTPWIAAADALPAWMHNPPA